MEHIYFQSFLSSLLKGNRRECSALIKVAKGNLPIIPLYETIIKQSLYHIGDLWENNKLSVASEHLATAIVEAILNDLYADLISDHRMNKNVVVACVENEFHQVGIKMVADIFEKNGWDSYFLGANTPTGELINFIKQQKPAFLSLSISIHNHFPVLLQMIKEIQTEVPDLPIMVGGQAFTRGGAELVSHIKGTNYIDNLENLEWFIQKLNGKN